MFNTLKKSYYTLGAAFTLGLMSSTSAFATETNTFSSISGNIVDSVANIPALLSAISYLFGLLLAALGVMKIKDHVENPTQTALKDGAIRLAAGGALFGLPIISEAMLQTVGNNGTAVSAADLNQLNFDDMVTP